MVSFTDILLTKITNVFTIKKSITEKAALFSFLGYEKKIKNGSICAKCSVR